MRKSPLLVALLIGGLLCAPASRADKTLEPEPLITLELTRTTLRSILESAFRATDAPFILPVDLPDAEVGYISVKRRPLLTVVELAFRGAGQDSKGLVVIQRDGRYELQRRPVEKVGLELPIPPVGERLTGTAGPVRLAISSLKAIGPGKIEVRIESVAPTDQVVSSRHESVPVFRAGNLAPRPASMSERRGIVPTFRTRGGVVLEFRQQMRHEDLKAPEGTATTGVLTVDPNDPPATVTWDLYLWRK